MEPRLPHNLNHIVLINETVLVKKMKEGDLLIDNYQEKKAAQNLFYFYNVGMYSTSYLYE